MKIDLEASEFKIARDGYRIIDAMMAEDGDKIRAVKLLHEMVCFLRESKEIPEVTRHVFTKHLERIASNEPLHFFDYKSPHRSENLSQKLETYNKVEELKRSGAAKNTEQAIGKFCDTINQCRSPESIKKDYYRGRKLIQEYANKLLSR
jgi:hypothetical protein